MTYLQLLQAVRQAEEWDKAYNEAVAKRDAATDAWLRQRTDWDVSGLAQLLSQEIES